MNLNLRDKEAKELVETGSVTVWRKLKPQPEDTHAKGKSVCGIYDYCTGAPKLGLAYYWRCGGLWNSSEAFFLPLKPGDVVGCRTLHHMLKSAGEVWDEFTGISRSIGGLPCCPDLKATEDDLTPGFWNKRIASHMPAWAIRLRAEVQEVKLRQENGVWESGTVLGRVDV